MYMHLITYAYKHRSDKTGSAVLGENMEVRNECTVSETGCEKAISNNPFTLQAISPTVFHIW